MEEARADDIDCASAGRSPTEPGSEGVNPIKSFVEARRQSVSDQLAGKSEGDVPGSRLPAPVRPPPLGVHCPALVDKRLAC